MSRPWRIEFAGACYHVINRGNYRRDLFNGKGAAEAFERTLDEGPSRRRQALTIDKGGLTAGGLAAGWWVCRGHGGSSLRGRVIT